jgi:hypothetical protein
VRTGINWDTRSAAVGRGLGNGTAMPGVSLLIVRSLDPGTGTGGACAGVNPQAHPSSELRVREIGFLSGVFFLK